LFDHFLATLSAHHRLRRKEVSPDVYPRLAAYAWPGNVRELRNACERLVVLGSDPLTVEQLPVDILRNDGVAEGSWLRPTRLSSGDIVPFQRFKVECQREYLEAVLQRTGWNVSTAARLLDLQRTHVHAKLVALGLARPEGSLNQAAEEPVSRGPAPAGLQSGR
jgi:DNA-binding NtrC family response regulator